MAPEQPKQWKERLRTSALNVAPLRAYTKLVRGIASVPLPRSLRRPVFGTLADNFGMDLSEAEHDVEEYRTFGDLFVRALRDGARPVDAASDAFVSPVDGCVSAAGELSASRLLQAKGIDYSLAELVSDVGLSSELEGGSFATLYLRPKDYHRIHVPADLELLAAWRIPGRLLPVQPWVVDSVPNLFAENERLIWDCRMRHNGARLAVIAVGATAVGAIESPYIAPTERHRALHELSLAKGAELGAFHLGSTVIIVAAAGALALQTLETNDEIRFGKRIATLQGSGTS